ncbi:MAG: hypothetical protein PHF35_04945 [Candidatus Moranbacteria bacterium]|nr:hypothetical protein [Candidatus Moranbacteria bacterium]
MQPNYDLDKIKFATDAPTFEKAVALYENGKVMEFEEGIRAYTAVVIGTKPYRVSVEAHRNDYGHCECYLGQNDTLCKHMVALAIYAVMRGKPLKEEDKKLIESPVSSGRTGELPKEEMAETKKFITSAMKYIKTYSGPSRIWFSYQNSLSEGCNRLSKIISELPVSEQTAKLLVDLLLRLDKKLCYGGVDDSDGTVGGFMEETVQVLLEYAKLDPACTKVFEKLKDKETCFGWEESLLKT